MKVFTMAAALVCACACSNAFGGELNLICTGEERYPSKGIKSPYSFSATLDLDSKLFRIQLVQDADNSKALYPRDNPWNEANCPRPFWKLDITDTEFRITTACGASSLRTIGGKIWEIRRTDGSFSVYTFDVENAKGRCVKQSERAF